jgi:hypothetical protein
MKSNFVLLVILICFEFAAIAQKHDNIWISGIKTGVSNLRFGNVLDFSSNEVELKDSAIALPLYMIWSSITISDKSGKLAFYTNGNVVANKNHKIMELGENLNPETPYGNSKTHTGEYFNQDYFPYSYMVYPSCADAHLFYLLHLSMSSSSNGYQFNSKYVKITKIDLQKNNEKGGIEYASKKLLDKIAKGQIILIKHGNGCDWWMLLVDSDLQVYSSILLQEDKISDVVENELGFDHGELIRRDSINVYGTPLQVSRDGSLIYQYIGNGRTRILAFDRCMGIITVKRLFDLPMCRFDYTLESGRIHKVTTGHFLGQFSQLNRYLYTGCADGFYQWDLESDDLLDSGIKLFGYPFPLDRNQDEMKNQVFIPTPQYGPDGKIYWLFDHTHYVIHHPERKGEACEFEGPRALGQIVDFDSPHYPNYQLGPLSGSACDTLDSGDTIAEERNILKIYPNPTPGPITVELELPGWDREGLELVIYDALGKRIYAHSFGKWTYLHTVDPGVLSAGIYIVQLKLKGRVLATEKIVVQ